MIGVGASAGGLEALTELLKHLPGETPLAIVVVQHLDPTRSSSLPLLLGHAGALPTVEARNGMVLAPGHVYVIGPGTQMTVVDGRLRVGRRPTDDAQYRPFDALLVSMAEQYQDRAMAVVLSGTGSDGAKGIRAVKAAGGITLAQAPEEAKFDGMPRAAIATGSVDLVLPARELAAELVRICRDPLLHQDPRLEQSEVPRISESGLDRIIHLLRGAAGVDFSQYKVPTVIRRIRRRMVLVRTETMDQYAALLEREPEEMGRLYDDMWIHVTSFFRDPDSYTALKRKVFSRLFKTRTDDPMRVWVPGCASGEEVYSLAIELLDFLGQRRKGPQLQIFGTDVSHRIIDHARAGVYPASVLADLDEEKRRRYFTQEGDFCRVHKRVRELCVFARQDLTRDPPFSNLDLIVCRNVLIYLAFPQQRKVMGIFHYALKPSGFLMLGRSETTSGQTNLFDVVDKKHKIYRRSSSVSVSPFPITSPFPAGNPSRLWPIQERAQVGAAHELDPTAEANRVIAERYGPAGVILDREHRIVRAQGDTAPFLQLPRGEARLDVLRMVREGLGPALRSALHEARASARGVRRDGLRMRVAAGVEEVNLDVTPIGGETNRRFLVTFERASNGAPPQVGRRSATSGKAGAHDRNAPRQPNGKASSPHDRRIAVLEKELEDSRSYVQPIIQDLETANEELQAANEEILSSNEELQSANEELDTAREEMQSTNEELTTLNDELQGRNDELARVNSDLQNLLASVQVPIVMVSTDLRIRRFTPAAERAFNVIAADVGRPIGHIKPNFDPGDLMALITDVIDSVSVQEREVVDADGAAFTLRVRPYKNLDNRIDGAVIALFDISALRMHEARLKVAQETGSTMMEVVAKPVLLLDRTLTVLRANAAFCEAFNVMPRETEGRFVYDLGNGQWNIPALRLLLEEVLPQRQNFDGFEVEHDFPGIGHRRLLLDGRRIDAGRNEGVIILIINQIAEIPS